MRHTNLEAKRLAPLPSDPAPRIGQLNVSDGSGGSLPIAVF